MRTSAVAMGLLLFVLSVSTIPAEQLESVDSIEDSTVTWEGDLHQLSCMKVYSVTPKMPTTYLW
ncbi:MAG: hypothetical protein Ct9H90mP16_03900 [Candidatus Poseidoniales archaeon]|nr:MAG: hypothetical protein Ct9H90mP16_03900 [Candidatus Poseidoniales archaeon]